MKVNGWDWMIGSGVYIDDLNAMLVKKVVTIFSEGTAIILILVFICLAVMRNVFKTIGGEPLSAIKFMQHVAEGNLNVQFETKHERSLLASLNKTIRDLASMIENIQRSSHEILSAANQIASGNKELSARTEESAFTLQAVASSVTQISTSAESSSDNSKQSKLLTTKSS